MFFGMLYCIEIRWLIDVYRLRYFYFVYFCELVRFDYGGCDCVMKINF